MKLSIIFILSLFSNLSSLHGYEKAEAFMVYLFEDRVKVLSPKNYHKNQSVIIENKTLTKVIGKIRNESGKVLKYVNIRPGEFKSVEVVIAKGHNIYFVPMVPSFQEVILSFGKRSYEVPSKK
ncbi:MAG: hypothetical protein HN576_16040 [Bacteriovoracaceae bacterium]|nr:hypothetical protein [Bacteriovoracaceae bacterium]